MGIRRAHTQPPHTHTLHQSCSYCYHPSHQIDDCPFFNHYIIEANRSAHEHAQTTNILVSEEKPISKVEEKEEHIEPPTNLSNDKEVSIEAHSFVTIPFETQHEPKASSFQCLEVPSYVEIFKESRTQRYKSRNRSPKKILLRNKVSYITWWNILPEGYQVLKKKGWKGLVGHPSDRGKCGIFFFFYFRHFTF